MGRNYSEIIQARLKMRKDARLDSAWGISQKTETTPSSPVTSSASPESKSHPTWWDKFVQSLRPPKSKNPDGSET